MAPLNLNGFDLVMNLIFAAGAVLFGWFIKRIPSDKGKSWFVIAYIILLVGMTAFWIGWIPFPSLTTLYASLLGIALWVGAGLYKLAPSWFESGRSWILAMAFLLIGAAGWSLFGWMAIVVTMFAIAFSIIRDVGEGIKVTKGKSDLSLGAWKGYLGRRGFWVMMSLALFLTIVALAHVDLVAISLLWLVLLMFGAMEFGKREITDASVLALYAVMTILLVYVLLTVSAMITF